MPSDTDDNSSNLNRILQFLNISSDIKCVTNDNSVMEDWVKEINTNTGESKS